MPDTKADKKRRRHRETNWKAYQGADQIKIANDARYTCTDCKRFGRTAVHEVIIGTWRGPLCYDCHQARNTATYGLKKPASTVVRR